MTCQHRPERLPRPTALVRLAGYYFVAVLLTTVLLKFAGGRAYSAQAPAAGNANTGAVAETDPVIEERLRREAPKAWAELEQFYRHIKGSFSNSGFVQQQQPPPPTDRGELAINGDHLMESQVAHQKRGNMDLERVVAKNDVYAFSISRRAGDPHARFAIERLEKIGESAAADKEIARRTEKTEALVGWPWRIYGRSLPEWEKMPGFVVKGARAVGTGEKSLVRVDFEGMDFGGSKNSKPRSGYIVFDPSDHWVVRESSFTSSTGAMGNAVCEYGRREAGFPLLTKRVEERGGPRLRAVTTLLLDVHHEVVPIEEFHLSHYGLPEPDFTSAPSHFLLWLFLNAGFICVAIAAFLWWRRRKAGMAN